MKTFIKMQISLKRKFYYAMLRFLKNTSHDQQTKIIEGVFKIVQNSDDPDLFDKNLSFYKFSKSRETKGTQRYKEQAPYMWVLCNGLPHAKKSLAKKVIKYIWKQKKHVTPTAVSSAQKHNQNQK